MRKRAHVHGGGELRRTCFRMFARGMTLPQIVVATKQPPDAIRELYREWSTSLDQGEWDRRDAADELRAFMPRTS